MTDQKKEQPKLFREPRHPYYVVAPDYRSNSAGIRVMHQLCDALRQIGEDAWIVTTKTHPRLNTPILTPETRAWHQTHGLVPIAIYPEVVGSNPLECQVVTRYILNRPGLLGQKPAYAEDDIFFVYEPELLDAVPHPEGVLHLPSINTSIFHNRNNPDDNARSGSCIYFGRYTEGPKNHADLAANCTVITSTWPATPEEMAQLLRRSEYLYCFENTALTTEARLCGCTAIILPSPLFNKDIFFGRGLGFEQGIAFSRDAAEREEAKRTVGAIEALYTALETSFWSSLDKLVEVTQSRANATKPALPPGNSCLGQPVSQHASWLAAQALTDADAQILAERMVLGWTHRPSVHLLMPVRRGENNLMADTLESLGSQLYPDWRLTVVSDLSAPEGWQELPNLQWLALRDAAHIDYVIDEMAAASPAQWIARIAPGVTMAPHALLLVADILQRHPEWQLIYTDEDVLQAKGEHVQPCFKPDFNLEYLRAKNYLGSLALVRKDAFLAAGRYGPHQGVHDYDLALRIADLSGSAAIGHVPRVLVHVSDQTPRIKSPEAESRALNEHLHRRGLNAVIQEGLQPATRTLSYECSPRASISVILPVCDELAFVHPLVEELKALQEVEVLVVNIGSRDPDMTAFLQTQKNDSGWHGRLKVLDATETSWPQTAASVARGDLLFFLDSHATAPKADDLTCLTALAQCADTAMVAPRLVEAIPNGKVLNDGWSLTGASGSHPAPHEPGLLGLGLCTHHKLAVSRLPLLIRKGAFLDAGGFDLVNFTMRDAVTDLCLRLNDEGLVLVWTPHVTLSLLTVEDGASANPEVHEDRQAQSSRRLMQTHLRQLACDATRHPSYCLEHPDQLDYHMPVAWTDTPGEKPRILLLVTEAEPAQEIGFYKAIARWQNDAQLLLTAIDTRARAVSPLSVAKSMPDAIVLHATKAAPVLRLLEELASMLPKIERVVRLDSLDFLPTRPGSAATDARPMLRKLLRHASKVIVPTQELAALCSGLVDQVVVHQSLEALSASEWLGYSFDRRRVGSTVCEPTTVS